MTLPAEEDFTRVVDSFYADLYRFAFKLSKNSHDACDLVQQTFTTFAKKRDSINDISTIKNWLYTTLYREFLSTVNTRQRLSHLSEKDEALIDPAIQTAQYREPESAVLRQALDNMPDHDRGILTLFYLDNHSYREIAEILSIPIGTVMSRLSRAKKVLRLKVEALSQLHQAKMVPYSIYRHDTFLPIRQ